MNGQACPSTLRHAIRLTCSTPPNQLLVYTRDSHLYRHHLLGEESGRNYKLEMGRIAGGGKRRAFVVAPFCEPNARTPPPREVAPIRRRFLASLAGRDDARLEALPVDDRRASLVVL